jgi:hypothetical protein
MSSGLSLRTRRVRSGTLVYYERTVDRPASRRSSILVIWQKSRIRCPRFFSSGSIFARSKGHPILPFPAQLKRLKGTYASLTRLIHLMRLICRTRMLLIRPPGPVR